MADKKQNAEFALEQRTEVSKEQCVSFEEQGAATSEERAAIAEERAAAAEKKAAAADALAAAFAARTQHNAAQVQAESGLIPLEGGVGLGVDIVEIERMAKVLARTPRFRVRVYSEEERAYCDRMAKPAVHYATRFAAKEAVLKALGTGFSAGIAPLDVEVKRNVNGRPIVALHGKAAEAARTLGVKEIPISLSYTHSEAVACAMALTRESEKIAEKRVDPMAELAQQFKDARAMLDELPSSEEQCGAGETSAEQE